MNTPRLETVKKSVYSKEGVYDHVVIDFRGFWSLQVQSPASRPYPHREYSTPTAKPEIVISGLFRTEVVREFRPNSTMDHLRRFACRELKEGHAFLENWSSFGRWLEGSAKF